MITLFSKYQSEKSISLYSITASIKSFKQYNNSSSKTVGVTYKINENFDPYTYAAASVNTGSNNNNPKDNNSRAKSGTLKVSAKASCSNYNHVGKNWSYSMYVNGTRISGTKNMNFTVGDTITVEAYVTEEDSKPDEGHNSSSHTITENDLTRGFKLSLNVSVRENGGRYSGSVADWNVVFTFTK